MYLDLVTYLPDDILAKVDRAAMAVSLETRIAPVGPSRRRVRLAATLGIQTAPRSRQGHSASDSRQARSPRAYRTAQDGLWRAHRQLVAWFPLREWASDLLGHRRLSASGMFDTDKIDLMWQQHLAGQRNWQARAVDHFDVPGLERRLRKRARQPERRLADANQQASGTDELI